MALPAFWMSYVPLQVIDTSSEFHDRSPACMISVVLDGDAYRNFSGIRLVIGHQEGLKGPENLLKDCHEAYGRGHNITGFPLPRHNDDASTKSFRTTLSRHRDVVTRSNMLLAGCLDGGIANHSRPLCTIVFELCTPNHGFDVVMALRQETTSATRLRIIYDRAVPCSVTERSLMANLELAHPYTFSGGDAALDPSLVSLVVFTHRIRVIPLSESRPRFRSLPADILHRIAWHAFSQRERGFRTQLLSWGMVCKAWLPLLDLFYEGLGRKHAEDTPDPGAVVRTLEHKPEKRRLIKVISPYNYAGARETNIERSEEFSQAFIALLELTTAVRHLTLPLIQPTLRAKLIRTLCTLKSVQICYTYNPYPLGPRSKGLKPFSMCEIQKFTAQWPVLRQLCVRMWGDRGCAEDHTEAQGQQYFTKLKSLMLYQGTMTGRQLLRFTSSSQPTLGDLSLHTVKGLSNSDLLEILLRVSPTLTYLSVERCVFPRAKEDDEYAIDAAMSKMECLTSASITGPELASVLAIARKPQRNTYYSNPRMSISIDGGSQFDMREIVAALEATGWGEINIWRSGPESGWDEGLAEETRKVVLHRHLRFSHGALR